MKTLGTLWLRIAAVTLVLSALIPWSLDHYLGLPAGLRTVVQPVLNIVSLPGLAGAVVATQLRDPTLTSGLGLAGFVIGSTVVWSLLALATLSIGRRIMKRRGAVPPKEERSST